LLHGGLAAPAGSLGDDGLRERTLDALREAAATRAL
jgi:hypothetical protein